MIRNAIQIPPSFLLFGTTKVLYVHVRLQIMLERYANSRPYLHGIIRTLLTGERKHTNDIYIFIFLTYIILYYLNINMLYDHLLFLN